jgi:hypothetical protein
VDLRAALHGSSDAQAADGRDVVRVIRAAIGTDLFSGVAVCVNISKCSSLPAHCTCINSLKANSNGVLTRMN